MTFFRTFLFTFFALLLAFSKPASALELGNMCADLLGKLDHTVAPGIDIHLSATQVLLRGELEAFWETGMEDQTGWCVADESREKRIFSSAYHSLFYLSTGDEVFVLNPDQTVMHHGYFDQSHEKKTIDIGYGPLEVNPNYPLLYADRERTKILLDPAAFATLFHKSAKVVAVHNVSEQEASGFKSYIFPEMKAYLANQNDPDRFIDLGTGKRFEMAAYEYNFSGPITYHFVEKEWDGKPHSYLQFDIETKEGVKHLDYWDYVFIFDPQGKLITLGRVDASYGLIVPTDLNKKQKFLQKLPDFSRVIVVRQKGRH